MRFAQQEKWDFDVTGGGIWRELAGDYYQRDRWTLGKCLQRCFLAGSEKQALILLLPLQGRRARGDNPYVNFTGFYSQGKCCYVKMEYPKLEQAVDIIHRNGGYAVLATSGS